MSNRIKELRKARGLTQAQLAELVGKAQASVARLEQGNSPLTYDWAYRLAPHLGVEPDDIISATEVKFPANGNGEPKTGQALLELKQRSGMSLRDIANGAGYAGASSLQNYFNVNFDGNLPPQVAGKLAKALAGKGAPPIAADEITSLVAYSANGAPSLSEPAAATIVLHLARKFGADVERGDPEVMKQARFLQALFKLLADRPTEDGIEWLEGFLVGADLQL
jgi:transcriptional regulator with XRE-family HTH domain